ncbi:hypothetical protein [Streptomyces sasae]|uniref:hypothetical protein n=1 Tax=Streptomyces sasae TaxID=1266772 RepID=UPI00292F39D0|nr:hypothetical protein [Streptomyces sasae]
MSLVFGFRNGEMTTPDLEGAETITLRDGQSMTTDDGNIKQIYITDPAPDQDDG